MFPQLYTAITLCFHSSMFQQIVGPRLGLVGPQTRPRSTVPVTNSFARRGLRKMKLNEPGSQKEERQDLWQQAKHAKL